jgi:hypothetical protein
MGVPGGQDDSHEEHKARYAQRRQGHPGSQKHTLEGPVSRLLVFWRIRIRLSRNGSLRTRQHKIGPNLLSSSEASSRKSTANEAGVRRSQLMLCTNKKPEDGLTRRRHGHEFEELVAIADKDEAVLGDEAGPGHRVLHFDCCIPYWNRTEKSSARQRASKIYARSSEAKMKSHFDVN